MQIWSYKENQEGKRKKKKKTTKLKTHAQEQRYGACKVQFQETTVTKIWSVFSLQSSGTYSPIFCLPTEIPEIPEYLPKTLNCLFQETTVTKNLKRLQELTPQFSDSQLQFLNIFHIYIYPKGRKNLNCLYSWAISSAFLYTKKHRSPVHLRDRLYKILASPFQNN